MRARRIFASDLHAGLGDEHDRRPGLHDAAGVLGVPAVEPDVDRPGEVADGELVGVTRVEHDGTGPLQPEHLADRQRRRHRRLVEDLVDLAVAHGVEREVRRRQAEPVGHCAR